MNFNTLSSFLPVICTTLYCTKSHANQDVQVQLVDKDNALASFERMEWLHGVK
jgi:hypothetical protein